MHNLIFCLLGLLPEPVEILMHQGASRRGEHLWPQVLGTTIQLMKLSCRFAAVYRIAGPASKERLGTSKSVNALGPRLDEKKRERERQRERFVRGTSSTMSDTLV